MHRIAQIYEEAKYDIHDLLRLHKMVKDLGMEKQDIINVLDLVKNNQVQTLQSKVDNLRDEIKMWEIEKTMAKHRVVRLKRTIYELECQSIRKNRDKQIDDAHRIVFANIRRIY
jgi:hypothetical protein